LAVRKTVAILLFEKERKDVGDRLRGKIAGKDERKKLKEEGKERKEAHNDLAENTRKREGRKGEADITRKKKLLCAHSTNEQNLIGGTDT